MSLDSYSYREIPAPAEGAPTLALFHGTGADETQFLGLAPQLLPQARLVAVRGDVSEHGALRYFKRTGEGVYDLADLALRVDKMAEFLSAIKGDAPLYGLGYSNGANIIAAVMFKYPDLFDAAVLMHPLIPFTPDPQPRLAGKRVLITAGQRDPICPPSGTHALSDYLSAQGAAVDVFWHPGGHEVRQEELVAIQRFTSTLS